jgi:hypothetical protein
MRKMIEHRGTFVQMHGSTVVAHRNADLVLQGFNVTPDPSA